VEPSSQDHKLPGLKRISGLDKQYVPKILDETVIDQWVDVTDEDAYRTAIKLARQDGILVGPTTGAMLHAALRYAKSNAGLAVVISPDDAYKYISFYRKYLDTHTEETEAEGIEHDLSDLVCPLSRIKVAELVDSLKSGEMVRIILGDSESLKSVAQELKNRSIKPDFEQKAEDRFILMFTK
jgi:TusA-related sulfurtransferase